MIIIYTLLYDIYIPPTIILIPAFSLQFSKLTQSTNENLV